MSSENLFTTLSDDVVLKIFSKLDSDPRNWSRLACVCSKFSSLVRSVCWTTKCHQTIPSVVSDLLPGDFAPLHKLAVCCPGLLHSGVLLENSDFGLEREIGPDRNYVDENLFQPGQSSHNNLNLDASVVVDSVIDNSSSSTSWSLYDDLYFDTVYNDVNASTNDEYVVKENGKKRRVDDDDVKRGAVVFEVCKRRKICRSMRSHLASGVWNLSREQGNKLLASRFRGDCLYLCDWPGCVHVEEKRNYMLFRGIFKDFKRSRVWRTINDGNRTTVDLSCGYCPSKEVWDLHSAFCLRPAYGFHDDGEPVVRAYVCENGHVSGAWTDWPLYT